MPHVLIECSANISSRPEPILLLKKIANLLPQLGPFNQRDIKSRMIYHDHYCCGDGAKNKAFIHLELSILSGRPDELKSQVSKALGDLLLNEFEQALQGLDYSITVDIRELNKACYTKILSPEM
ncbi:5-carboxymethyl-2-hydroxymuconate Delta-isomerase [bacterium]|nr:5-carboxymethyl-2-hydroxymuconate Delta-isomerase [bacterium]